MTDKQEPWDHGIFKGADGLRKLVDSQPFWDEQSYGTRLYFGPNITDYLHRDVLRAAVEHLERAAPPAQPAEPDMRHPKIQSLIGSRARCQIELQLVEQLLEDPNFEATSMDMEHWGPLHDKLKMALAAQPADRTCTCHPDDSPPVPCAQKYALTECRAAQPAPAQEPRSATCTMTDAPCTRNCGLACSRQMEALNGTAPAQRLSDEMDAIAIKHAHKMALDLECILAEYGGSWYNTAMQTLGEYRSEMNAIHERESPTFMGEPLIAAAPKASHDR